MKTTNLRTAASCRGLTLVELMVAITVGMLIVAAMSLLFANNSRTRSETERSSQKVENGRFALDQLSGELQHAGFFAEFDPTKLTAPAALPDPCSPLLADMRSGLALPIQGVNNVATVPSCLTDVKAGTDILVVRRASTCTQGSAGCTAAVAGAPLFQASSCNNSTELGSTTVSNYYRLDTAAAAFNLTKRDCTTVAPTRRYLLRFFYVANNDKPGDGIPTLKKAEMTSGSGGLTFTATSLVQGVENLQIDYGMDTDNDGAPDVYTADPGSYGGCATTSPSCPARWISVVSAKVYVLARNIDQSPGWQDTKVYNLGSTTVPAANDAYKRSVFQEVVRVVNVSARRF